MILVACVCDARMCVYFVAFILLDNVRYNLFCACLSENRTCTCNERSRESVDLSHASIILEISGIYELDSISLYNSEL